MEVSKRTSVWELTGQLHGEKAILLVLCEISFSALIPNPQKSRLFDMVFKFCFLRVYTNMRSEVRNCGFFKRKNKNKNKNEGRGPPNRDSFKLQSLSVPIQCA